MTRSDRDSNTGRYLGQHLSIIFVDEATIAIEPGHPSYNGSVTYFGTAKGQIDLISVGLKYQFAPPPAPLHSRG